MRVYFIQVAQPNGPIKIGIAADVRKRLEGLQTGNPERLVLLAELAGGVAEEIELHARFDSGRIRGEWFRADTPGLAELIAWILRHDGNDLAVLPAKEHVCSRCNWPLESELADRGETVCWTCKTEAATA